MKYVSKSFRYYDEEALNNWMHEMVSQGYSLIRIISASSNAVFVTMELK